MVYAVITGILFAALFIGAAIWLAIYLVNDGERTWIKCVLGGVCLVMAVLVFLIPGSFRTVNAGEVAVVKHMGRINNIRTPGTYFDFWLTDNYSIYDAKVQNIDISTAAYSSDAQTMDIQMTVQFQIQTDKVKEIAEQYGDLSALENRIQNVVIERTKSVLSRYSAMQIIEERAAVSPEVAEAVRLEVDDGYYVTITTVVLSNIDFSDAFEKVVEDKMIAEQEKLKAEYEKEKAIIQAEQELEVAKLAAEAAIAKAQGDADAQKVIAEAEAYGAQVKIVELARTLGYTVTETQTEGGTRYTIDWGENQAGQNVVLEYIRYLEYLATWNGELPSVVAGDSLQLFVPAI